MSNARTKKNNRKGLSIIELTRLFPDDNTAMKWFEKIRWGGKIKALPIKDTSIKTTHRIVFEGVEIGSQLYTDDARHWTSGVWATIIRALIIAQSNMLTATSPY